MRVHYSFHFLRSTLFADSVWNSGEVSELNAVATVHSLVAYSETVVLVALEMDRGHSLIMHAAADFYELVREGRGDGRGKNTVESFTLIFGSIT